MEIKDEDRNWTFEVRTYRDGKYTGSEVIGSLVRLLGEIEEDWMLSGNTQYQDNFTAMPWGYQSHYTDGCGEVRVEFHRREELLTWNWARPL